MRFAKKFCFPSNQIVKLWHSGRKCGIVGIQEVGYGKTAEDLERIKGMGVPEMNQAINAYYSITASPEFQEIERMREKARHDEAQALHTAEQKGIQKGLQRGRQEGLQEGKIGVARNLIKIGVPLRQIAEATGWTIAEVEDICSAP